jgi:hypothetical protein
VKLRDNLVILMIIILKEESVRVRTHKDYRHGYSEPLSCDMSADIDEGTRTSSV